MTEEFQRLHGHSRGVIVTETPGPGVSRLTLSSAARLLIDSVPTADGLKVYVQFSPTDGGMPRGSAVDRDLDAPDPTASAVGRGSGHRHRADLRARAVRRARDGRARWRRVGRRVAGVSSGCSVEGWTPMSANRFTVACCIRDVGRRRPASIVIAVEAPRPLHRARTEHERAARGAVQRQVVGRGSVAVRRAVVEQQVGDTSSVVEDMSIRPGGREPLSTSTSHS